MNELVTDNPGNIRSLNITQKILKNSGIIFLGQIFTLALKLLVMVWLARFLGEVKFGMLSFGITFINYFAIFPDFGMKPIIVREISRDSNKGPTIIGLSIILKFFLSTISIIAAVLVAVLIGYSRELIIIIGILSLNIFVSSKIQTFRGTFESIFEANLNMGFPILFRMLDAMVMVGLIALFIYLNCSITEITLVYVLSAICGFLLTIALSLKYFKPELIFDMDLAKWLILQSLPLAIYVALTRFYMNADIFFLKMLKGDAAVGYYSAAYRLTVPLDFIPAAIVMSLFPLMSKFYQDSKEKLVQSFNFCLKILVLLGLAFGLGTTFLYKRLIVFLYTEKFQTAALPLMLLMWAECLIFLIFFLVDFHTSVNKQRRNTYAAIIMFLSNVILNLIFIPKWGIVGASFAKLFTILIGFSLLYYSAHQIIEFSSYRVIKKIIPIGLSFSILLYWIRNWNLFLILPIAAIVYVLLIFLWRFFSKDENRIIRELLTRIKFSVVGGNEQ